MAKLTLGVAAGIAGLTFVTGAASAGVKPGDVITPQNAPVVKDIVSPGVYYAVTHGMHMNIVPTERIDWPPPYKEATEKYSSQVRLTPDHRSLVGYVAGQPFPLIDANDPDVANKLIWNTQFRPIATDDLDLRFFDCESEYVKPGQDQKIVDEIQVGHFSGYSLLGRTEVDPLPVDPDFKKTNRMGLFALYPILAPQEARGGGLIRWRYQDPAKGDDSWVWEPGTRRVRRLNEAILSTSSGAQTTDPDHYAGFNPKVEEYDYKFIGDRNMLASEHAEHSPEQTCPYDGGATACPEAWEMRHMYIVSAKPRPGINQGSLDKETIIFIDTESWAEPYVDTYDRSGKLWKAHIFWTTYRDRPVPDARIAVYPFKRQFVLGAAAIDTQGNFSTMCYLPGQHTPERECWYINMGAVDKTFFTIQSMVKAAP
ncbi:MAG TPA: DUF1329 domain-containing protein [Candidatus Binataceae bacterium]|nr:DUF1329 domain-containing protein [Candidatus Binataceae bacterium]